MLNILFQKKIINYYGLTLIVVVIFSIFLFFLNLDKRDLSQDIVQDSAFLKPIMQYHWKDVHEKRYWEISKNILDQNNWGTLIWEGRSYYNKGPVFFWLSALMLKVTNGAHYAPRILSAVFSLGIIFLTYLLAKDIFNRKVAVWATVILATSVHFVIASREGTLDITFVFWGLASLYFYFKYQGNKHRSSFFIAMILLAVMGLTKSIFSVIPIALTYFVLDSKNVFSADIYRNITKWIFGILILVIPLASWIGTQAYLYPQYQREGVSFPRIFSDSQLNKSFFNTATTYEIVRYSGGKKYAAVCADSADTQKICPEYDNPFFSLDELKKISNILYYPFNILEGFFPWSILLILALLYNIWLAFKHKDPKLKNILFIFVVVALMFILAFEKRVKWLVILYPFFAMFCANLVSGLLEDKPSRFLKFGFVASMILFSTVLVPFNFQIWQFGIVFYALLFIVALSYIFTSNRIEKIFMGAIMTYFVSLSLIGAVYPVLLF